jgi:hypothetical protein
MKSIMTESLLLDSINLDLSVKNGFKLFTQATFSQIRGHNSNTNNIVDLTFPNLNSSININPASGGLYDYVASTYNIAVNSGNSNILNFIENLPDSIQIGFTISINPDGNITGGDDEYFPNSSLDLLLDGELPLKFSANNLSLMDTFQLDFEQQKNAIVNEGKITIDYVNSFPIGVTTSLILLDENFQALEALIPTTPIIPAAYDMATSQSIASNGTSTYIINESSLQNLETTKHIVYNINLTTDQVSTVKINIDDYFNFNLYSDLNLKFSF